MNAKGSLHRYYHFWLVQFMVQVTCLDGLRNASGQTVFFEPALQDYRSC